MLPSTLLGVGFTDRYRQPLPAGIIPPSARWIRLWYRFRVKRVEVLLPALAECVWCPSDGEGDNESDTKRGDDSGHESGDESDDESETKTAD